MEILNKISTKVKNTEEKFIKSKSLVIVAPVFLILIILLLYAPLLLSNKSLRNSIENKFAEQLNAELRIGGKVKTALFPSPHFVINEIYIKDLFTGSHTIHLHSKEITLKMSIFSALFSDFNIKSINIKDATIEVSSSNSTSKLKTPELKQIIAESQLKNFNQKGIGGNLFSLDRVDLTNSNTLRKINFVLDNVNFVYYSKLNNKKQINKISASSKVSSRHIGIKGVFYNHSIPTNFDAQLNSSKKDKDSYISISSDVVKLSSEGRFSSSEGSQSFFENYTGTIKADILNLKEFYRIFSSDKNYIYNKIKNSSQPVSISSPVLKKGSELIIENCEIKSQIMNGLMNLNIFYIKKLPIVDLSLNLDFIDLDSVFNEGSPAKTFKKDHEGGKSIADKDPDTDQKKQDSEISKITQDLRDFDLNLELKVNKAKYLFEEIKEVDLYTSISKSGEVLILPLKFKTPGGGDYRITGILDSKNNDPKFIGKLDATGEDLASLLSWLKIDLDNLKYDNLKKYSIYSNIFQKPGSTFFDNLYINIEDGPEILGESSVHYQLNSSYIISKLDINNFNVNKLFQTSSKNTYLSPGPLLKKLLWINSIKSQNDIDLSIDNLLINDNKFDTNSFKVKFGKGYFEVDDLRLESNNQSDISASIAVEIKESISKFNLLIKSDNLILENHGNNIEELRKKTSSQNLSITQNILSLPSFENFNGNIKVDLKNTKISDDLTLSNSILDAKIANGIVKFRKFESGYNQGKLNFSGSAALKFDKSISGNLTLSQFSINDIVEPIYNIDNVDGSINLASAISSFGSTEDEFLSNLSLKAKYNASTIVIDRYGLDNLIRKMFNFKKYRDEISDPQQILFSPIESTTLKQSSGTFLVNKNRGNIFKANFSGTAFNGTLSAKFNNNTFSTEGSTNIIFLTGTKKKQVPINIVSNFNGRIDDLNFSSNLSQAQQYIEKANYFYSGNRKKYKKPSQATNEQSGAFDTKIPKVESINNSKPTQASIPNFDGLDPETQKNITKSILKQNKGIDKDMLLRMMRGDSDFSNPNSQITAEEQIKINNDQK